MSSSTPDILTLPPPTTMNLNCPYFDQTNDGPEGWRHCQSSSIAMVLAFHGLAGIQDDLDYFRVVCRYGDTTNQGAHAAALHELGVSGTFRTDLSAASIRDWIKHVGPVVVGVLHHGLPSHPCGGGHYVVIRGWDETGWFVNDPYGELDCTSGQWCAVGRGRGENVHYSYANFSPRMFVEGDGSCWGWLIK